MSDQDRSTSQARLNELEAENARLRENEARYRTMLESVRDYAIVLLDSHGLVVSWGSGAEVLTGYSATEMVGQSIARLYPPEDVALDILGRELAQARQKGRVEAEYWRERKDGSRFWANTVITALQGRSDGQNGFVVVARDLTEARAANDALRQARDDLEIRVNERTAELQASETRFRMLLEGAPDAVIAVDHDGKIIFANGQTEVLFGYSQPELLGKPIEMLIPERYHHHHVEHRSHYSTTPRVRAMGSGLSLSGRRANGSEFPVDLMLSPIITEQGPLTMAIVRDVTERREAEARIKASEMRFRTLLEGAPDAVIAVDQQGKITFANGQTEVLFGYPYASLLGQSIEMLIPQRYHHRHLQHRQNYTDAPRVRAMGSGLALSGRRADGSEFPVDLMLSPIATEQGTLTMAIVRNVTERRQAEERIQAALEEKETLLKEIHHRVKNNLQVVASLFDLQAGTTTDPAVIAALREGQCRVRSMALIHETLYRTQDFSRIPFTTYLEQLSRTLLSSYAGDTHHVALDIEAEHVFLDLQIATPCGLLVNELLANSLKHAFPNKRPGRITVTLRRQDEKTVCLMVADDGIGLPPGFEPTRATSLGLQLVQMLSRQIRGKPHWDSQHGTRFELNFPA
ncbi:PAS domain S-box protein [Chitinimonas lacunae]|uniref:PAS domain S-box protein n=1 Tax=Chitinimonas lacunae TaxID=1963018 RepID=A0ABV8MKL4_9NEIS